MTSIVTQPIDEGAVMRLRREFDETFAKPSEPQVIRESFLGMGLRGDPFAIRIRQIEGVLTERRVVALPTAVAAFAGLTTHRGSLVAVYDLGMLLGYAGAATLRWVVTVRVSDAVVGLAFDRFDGHYRVVAAAETSDGSSGLLAVVPGMPDGRPVIDVLFLLDSVLRLETTNAEKES